MGFIGEPDELEEVVLVPERELEPAGAPAEMPAPVPEVGIP